MNSTSISDTILEVRDLNVVFRLNYYRADSFRDSFVKAFKSPIDTLLRPKDSLHVLKDLSLTLKKGERLGIIGVNGTGKTTLCRAISGMLLPRTGSIKIHGEIRSIFNTTIAVNPELTGRENAILLAHFFYPLVSHKEREDLIADALAFSELGNFLDAPFYHYSKGMQARLCLSLVSARPCDLLILDEVFDGADEFFQKKIAARVLQMIHASGAVIFVSHSPAQIHSTCNRVIVLNESKIAFDGTPGASLEFYRNLGGQKI